MSVNALVPLGFQNVGNAGISAQQMFLGSLNKVYILDKTENNPVSIAGDYGTHPAWAVEYDISTNKFRTMDVDSNTFCAGGSVMANGTWVVFGGNQPVTTGGAATADTGAYHDTDGGTAIRMLTPCDDDKCQWVQGIQPFNITSGTTGGWLQMSGPRWYPTVETLEDGALIILSGDKNGGYVSTFEQNNPTYEFFPPRGDGSPFYLDFLNYTVPTNLYPLTWLMPSGRLFIQAGRSTIMFDHHNQTVYDLPDMPFSTRVYPGSAATALLPLTPANNYTATLLFCGGSNTTEWGNDGGPGFNISSIPADNSCVRITPEAQDPTYTTDDYMFEGRSMGQFVILPDGTLWNGNGVGMGTAGYGSQGYSVGQSFGQDPVYMPAIYNHSAPPGSRWNRSGLSASPNERMYHSTAILLPDSSILISGSNPNADFTNAQWRTRTDVERWYPWYYTADRPSVTGVPPYLSYGGEYFNITLGGTYNEIDLKSARVVIHRNGYNTHAMGFGQRMLELESTYSLTLGKAVLHVSQLPGYPGPTLFQPGPALLFVLIHSVPSHASWVVIGSGEIGIQPTSSNSMLPESSTVYPSTVASAQSPPSSTMASSSKRRTPPINTHHFEATLAILSLYLGAYWGVIRVLSGYWVIMLLKICGVGGYLI